IVTSQEFYDFSAKYERADTQYILDPVLPPEVQAEIAYASRTIYERIGCRDIARVDFMVDEAGAWFLEINSMPGMTDHSLVPKAAAHAGITFPKMCARLVEKSQARMKGNHRMARNAAAASPSVVADSTTATMTQEQPAAQDQTND
ncbi:MAG: D-alanine--D-alanine ligase, partial [Planctomycetota bacterium]